MISSGMKNFMIVLSCCIAPMGMMAQQVLTVRIDRVPPTHVDEPIYLTGNFNGWNPAAEEMRLQRAEDGSLGITVQLKDVPSDRVEYKFTRGSWQHSECTAQGRLTSPRLAALGRDTTIVTQIAGWRDDFPASTASENVHLLNSAFYMPQLDRHRKIWIYLPAGYASNSKRYPVIYMQDGQHLFDEATSQGRIGPVEWAVDETLDEVANPCIVVAINHQDDYQDREPEFFFHPNEQHPEVEGQQYIAFIVETLKPYVDRHYRTLPDKDHTAIAGSSLGGLVSFYAGLYYPEIFGILGVFSPSIWLDEDNLEKDLEQLAQFPHQINEIGQQHIYFYAGQQENRRKPDGTFVRMQDDVARAIESLEKVASPKITLKMNPAGRHGALYWRETFPDFYQWFSGLVFEEKREN